MHWASNLPLNKLSTEMPTIHIVSLEIMFLSDEVITKAMRVSESGIRECCIKQDKRCKR